MALLFVVSIWRAASHPFYTHKSVMIIIIMLQLWSLHVNTNNLVWQFTIWCKLILQQSILGCLWAKRLQPKTWSFASATQPWKWVKSKKQWLQCAATRVFKSDSKSTWQPRSTACFKSKPWICSIPKICHFIKGCIMWNKVYIFLPTRIECRGWFTNRNKV